MEKKTRKYFRVKVHRIPPYYPINTDYYFEEDVWAYSREGAINKINKHYKGCYGEHLPVEVLEVSKADFRGDKKIKM